MLKKKCLFTMDKFITILISFGVLIFLSIIFVIGKDTGINETKANSTSVVCNRDNNPAPRDWCEKIILLEVLKIR